MCGNGNACFPAVPHLTKIGFAVSLSRDGPPNGFQELIAFNGDCGDEDVGWYNGDALPKCGASVTDVSWRQCFAWSVQYRLYATGTENNWIELGWA